MRLAYADPPYLGCCSLTGQLVPNPSLPQWMRQEAIADGCPA